MSLIPYSSSDRESQEVVLRHQSTLVLYDPKRKELALRDLSEDADSRAIDTLSLCPYCRRSLSRDHDRADGSAGVGHGGPGTDPGFVDRDYFRMLDSSHRLPPPDGPSLTSQRPPPSPTRRRLPIPARVDDINDHPPEIDFIVPDGVPRRESTGGISSSAFSPGYFERFFVTEGELGRGGKGVVLLVRHILDGVSLGHFACKRVPVGDNHEWLEKVLAEVQLLQQLSHTNLVSYRHVWLESVKITNFGPKVPCAFILQQYCNAGDLHSYILKSVASSESKEDLKERMRRRSRGQPELPKMGTPRRIPFEHIISFFRDIASGLSHLHASGFIHRDLKPQNCLLMDSGVLGQPPRVLVSDFGEVQMENAMRSSTGATGTISYCAPEVLQRVGPNGRFGNFTTKSDVFSLGMILYFMCFGNLPYENADSLNEENEDLDRLRDEISAWKGMTDRERLRPDLPERLYSSLDRLLSPNPAQRPSAEEILLGLNMGVGMDDSPLRTSKSNSPTRSPDEEISNRNLGFRRISPISDTPPASSRSSSPKRRTYSTFNDFKPSTLPSRSSKLRELPLSPDEFNSSASTKTNLISTTITSSPDDTSTSTTTVEESISTTNGTSGPISPGSLVLRPRMDSQSLRLSEIPMVLPPLARRARMLAMLRSFNYGIGVKLLLFLSKVISLTRPCSPLAPNPWIYYPLLSLAALDFAATTMKTTIVLLLIHMSVLSIANAFSSMCLYY